jgi:hypothetical protein
MAKGGSIVTEWAAGGGASEEVDRAPQNTACRVPEPVNAAFCEPPPPLSFNWISRVGTLNSRCESTSVTCA